MDGRKCCKSLVKGCVKIMTYSHPYSDILKNGNNYSISLENLLGLNEYFVLVLIGKVVPNTIIFAYA